MYLFIIHGPYLVKLLVFINCIAQTYINKEVNVKISEIKSSYHSNSFYAFNATAINERNANGDISSNLTTQSPWAVEYTNCISAEGLDFSNDYPSYDTKQSWKSE